MAAWIACALCALVIIKPQEFVREISGLPLVHAFFALTAVACFADVVRRRVRPSLAPHVPFMLAFFAWSLAVTAVKRPDALPAQLFAFAVLAGLFFAVAIGCASAAGVRAFALTFTACAALATVVALVQSQRPFGCFLAAPDDWEGRGELTFDGRACETALDCRKDAPIADGNYRCERRGPLATATIGGRVRYRGSLADPNELSLAISVALPLAIALGARSRRRATTRPAPVALPPLVGDDLLRRIAAWLRGLPVLALHVAVAAAVVLSRSRTGLLVFLAVVGMHAIRRSGGWAIVAGCVVGPPMLLLGGRSGTEADESAGERAEILREAFELIRMTKGFGLGAGQFTDNSSIGMTAHNAYLLAAAEAGIVGYLLFCLMLYLALKIPVSLWLGERAARGSAAARFSPAIATALGGLGIGIFFLSWTYKDVLYLLLGGGAALHAAARARDPGLRVGLSLREAALVSMAAMGLLAVVYVGSRLAR